MTRYVTRRVLATVPVLLLVSVGAFLLLHLIPGDPVLVMLGERADPQVAERLRHDLGLGRPLPVQYVSWLGDALQGDLGRSIRSPQPVAEAIAQRFPVTLQLAAEGMLLALVVAIPMGVLAATRPGSAIDRLATLVASLGVAVPSFSLGVLLILAVSLRLRWLPPSGYESPGTDLGQNLRLMVLPAITLAAALAAELMRITRASVREALAQDYPRTARAKGLTERAIVVRHCLKNALIPVVTVIGLQFGHLLGGAVIVETLYAIPGMGRLLVDSIAARDFPMVQGVVLVTAMVVVASSLVVDLLYGFLDPRIRHA